ncbi:LacI family transcriptional regulator [Tessaracoccus sp. OS52]|uniref:LacI family DNA-binding transcriptional regulator n=1 Tax=Tessaracoccus sp. OS52 TaxID=2886691 RepID=UPI001D0FDAAB|nr:LacI family DNA-binding transcriptional regulator [Tessaracoccus sp. OS52]MCC2594569.1 LacI family transcriptional regulator [Tessaracoccus sp. OS52]
MVTIADVAEAANVSISTVSYVMSGKRKISQETQDRVARAIEELGYRPHAGARALASRSTSIIGLQAPLRPGVDVHVVMEIVTGVATGARGHDYDILLLTSDDTTGLERAANSSMVDALIVMDVESDDERLGILAGLHQPCVLIGLPSEPGNLACVDFDFEAAGHLAVEHLTAQGHRRVALIGSPAEVMARHTSYADRLARGFTAAAAQAGIAVSIHPCPSTPDAVAVIDEVFAAQPDTTALFIHNEEALPHLLARLSERGQRIPADIAVVALCPPNVARTLRVPVDTIDIPAEEIGMAAADVVWEMIADGAAPSVRLIPPTLSLRPGLPLSAPSPAR